MTVLIVTEPDDIHAVLVKLALEKKDINCELFFTADMPTKQKNNIYISNTDYSWGSLNNNEAGVCRYDVSFDAIWWRRPRRPYVQDNVHKEDMEFVKRENAIYHDSIPYLFDERAWWVNPVCSQQKTRSKIVQLKLARECGFKLPETLISNSPEDIKEFVKLNTSTGVIYKPFFPQCWAEQDGLRMIYTDKISIADLPSDSMLQVVPGIYQQYVEKKYELRVTCFGSCINAVKIDSQKHSVGKTDWRKIPGHELSLSEIELPQDLKDKIILFMKKIGVVFGCFDFIVTLDNEFVFLELNEQGQFLWVEEALPELCYLDMFSEFIINKSFNFSWKKTDKTLFSSDFDSRAKKIVYENIEKHIYLNQVKRVA